MEMGREMEMMKERWRSVEGEWEIETDRERKGEDEADIDEKGVHLQKMEKKEIKNVSWKQ